MKVSVIIPTYNRYDSLRLTLESIINQNFSPNEFEVIVIHNGSTDETKEVCKHYSSVIKNFIYHHDEMPGLLTGRHRGAFEAKGEILCFLDDDVNLASDWLKGIKYCFEENPDVDLVTGPCLPKYEKYPPEWLNYFWSETPYGGKMCTWLSLLDLGRQEIYIDPIYVWGLNFSIRRNTLFELGGFNPDSVPSHLQQFQGDGETGLSLKANVLGYKAFYTYRAMLYHRVPKDRLSVNYFEKRAFYQGICDSYTKIRKDNNFYCDDKNVVINKNEKKQFLFKKIARKIKARLKHNTAKKQPKEIQKIQHQLHLKYIEGYNFHQQAFQSSESIRNWVLKNDYWDYKLPGYD